MIAYIRDAIALGFPVAVGLPIVIGLRLTDSSLAALGLAFLCGSAATGLVLLVLGIAGLPLTTFGLAGLLIAWLIASAWFLRRHLRRPNLARHLPAWHPLTIVVVLLTVVNLATVAIFALTTNLVISDVVNVWLPKADALARTHAVLALARTTFPDYPPLWPLHVFLARAIAGHAGAVKLVPAVYLASLLAALFRYLSVRTSALIAAITVWVISGIPYLWFPYGANALMAEVPFTAFLVASTLGLVRYLEDDDIRHLAGGVLLATAATLTRPEGIQHAVLVAIVAAVVAWRRRRWDPRMAAMLVVPLVVYSGWHVAVEIAPHARGYAVDLRRIPEVVTPGAVAAVATYTVQWLANPFVFGPTVIAAALCVAGYRRWRRTWPWLAMFVLGLGAVAATYLIAPASNDQPLSWWLVTGYKRLLMHIVPLLFVAAALAVPRREEWQAANGFRRSLVPTVAVAASLLVAAAVTFAIPGTTGVPLANVIPNGAVGLSPDIAYGKQTAGGLADDPAADSDWMRLQVVPPARGSVTYDLSNLATRQAPNDDVVGRFSSLSAMVAATGSGAGTGVSLATNGREIASVRPPPGGATTSVRVGIAPDTRAVSLIATPTQEGSSVQAVWVRAVLNRGGAWPLVALLLLVAAAASVVSGLGAPPPGRGGKEKRPNGWMTVLIALLLAAALIQQLDVLTNQAVPLWSEGAHSVVHWLRAH